MLQHKFVSNFKTINTDKQTETFDFTLQRYGYVMFITTSVMVSVFYMLEKNLHSSRFSNIK